MMKFYFTFSFLIISLFSFAQSTEVGVTEGELSVSLSGAATYTIPIAVPPGINGVIPKINLTYNSQGDSGSAGYGWNVSGLSSIKRIPSTKFHDGISDSVDFDSLDRFSLDGQRLIVKNGIANSYGLNETVYETENFSNIKITSYGVHSSGSNYGPAYFKVEYPDGSKAFYGNSTDSRSVTDWAITYWENAQGIRISYEYSLINNVLNIVSIKYGGRLGSTPINEIKFVYKSRQREEQTYTGGLLFIKNKILSTINVLSNGVGFRNYNLAYDVTSLFYERLISITEKSGDNSKSYNPTLFEYENTADTVSVLDSFTALSVNPTPVMPEGHVIDMNAEYGDNNMKILGDFGLNNKFGLITFSSDVQKRSNYILYPNIDSNTTSAVGTKIYTKSIFDEIFLVNTLSGNDSSGYKLKQNQNWCIATTNRQSNLTTFSVYSNTPQGNTPAKLEHEIKFTFPMYIYDYGRPDIETARGVFKSYLSGDFNGDNITDAIVIECGFSGYIASRAPQSGDIRIGPGNDTSGGNVYFVNLDPRVSSNAINFAGRLSGEFRKNSTGQSSFFAADIDGDGKTDIVVANKNIIDVYSLNDANTFVKVQTLTIPVDYYGYSQYLSLKVADYNGDGKIDYGPQLFSNGISFAPSDNANATLFVPGSMGKYIDFNNDGVTDVFSIGSNDGSNLKFSSTTNLFPLAYKNISYDYTFSHKYNYRYEILNNKNSLSKNQLVLFENGGANDNVLYYVALNKDFSKEKLLKSVTLGNGIKESVTYSSLLNGNGVYTANPLIENYPNQDIVNAPELKVVSKIEKQSKSQYKKQLFFYSGAVTNLEGLGFLGFYSTVKTNWHDDNSQIISYVSKNDINKRGANVENYEILGLYEPLKRSSDACQSVIVKEGYTVIGNEALIAGESITLKPATWIKPGSNFSAKINLQSNVSVNVPTDYIKKIELNYQCDLLSNKVFKVKNILKKEINKLEDTSNETKMDYDSFNNPTNITTTVKEGATVRQTSITDMAYQNLTLPVYVIGRQLSKAHSVTLGNEKMTTDELYSYNSTQLLSQIQKKGDASTTYITEDRTYDLFGNILKKTMKAGQETRELNYEYDSSGRFLNKISDAEKLVSTFQYNANGTLKSETNPLLQTTTYEYDVWLKKTKETNYLGNANYYNYLNNNGITIITKTFADGNVTEETLDELGRKIKLGSKNIMGTFSFVSYLYDIQDRNYKVSEPYIGVAPSQWNETKYDNYGRVSTQNKYTGKTISIVYAPLTTKVSDGIITKTYKKDALGNVLSIVDKPSNEITYTYYANGDLKESNYDGIKIKILQDGWGRKVELQDPSAGVFKYKYNDFGELTSEENKNGTTTYKLSAAGRLEEKIVKGFYTDSKTTYRYDDINKLPLSTIFEDFSNGTNTITTSYIYNDKKQLSDKIETTPYAVFTKKFSYDAVGRLATENFTAKALRSGKTSVKTIKCSYKYGSQYQITDESNAVLWQTNTVNARGQLLTAQNGPLTITNTYDSDGYNLQSKFDKTASSTNILSLTTNFDTKTGNLNNRGNTLFAWNESFKYDVLDRLEEYTNNKGILEIQKYDDKGRITQNSLGTYDYAKDNPYQNVSIAVSSDALTYYTAKPSQIITYNIFKSPVLIDEKNIDRISFEYNNSNGRTAMFYGDLQDEKLKRPYRKYYAEDGAMEIKENIQTGVTDFVTYIGGDGYTAPVVFKSDGTNNQKYLYLQRDYQGSIVGITDQTGAIVEKRIFDAWGAVAKVQDGSGNALAGLTLLDRGYTGHEHLQSVGLINMNGRIYDPKLHRFLQPDNNIQDPFNTQSYNRYGYVVNNPLKFTDPSGEIWGFVLGFLGSLYIHGGAASGGETNPFKWNSSTWVSAFSGTASSVASYNATTGLNSYTDNYNNKPVLGVGASAIGPNHDLHTFVDNSSLTGEAENADSLNWYGTGGQVNWAFGTASGIGVVKGGLNSERMYAEGVRRGISANYQLMGRNLSMFRDASMTKATIPISKVGAWGGIVGHTSFGVGVAMDIFGVWNYKQDPNSPNAVHPAKAALNTIMGAIGNWGGTTGAISSTLYFGIDGFYPGGWQGLGIDQERLYQENKTINPNYQAFPGAMKL